MNSNVQRWCVWAGPALMVAFVIGLWFVAGFVPPPAPSSNAQEIARLYSENRIRIRAGSVIVILAAMLVIPWAAVISVQLKRIEGHFSPLAYTQLGAGTVGVVLFLVPAIFWEVAAYRPDVRSADSTMLLNDVAWFFVVGTPSLAIIQGLAIGIAIFSDKSPNPVFPRWAGYFNVWCVTLFIPGAAIYFFMDGPLAWNGLFAFWIPLSVFGAWFFVMAYLLLAAISRHERSNDPANSRMQPAA